MPRTPHRGEVLISPALTVRLLELYSTASLGTVKTHLSSLQDKLGARNRVELAAFAASKWRLPRHGKNPSLPVVRTDTSMAPKVIENGKSPWPGLLSQIP